MVLAKPEMRMFGKWNCRRSFVTQLERGLGMDNNVKKDLKKSLYRQDILFLNLLLDIKGTP